MRRDDLQNFLQRQSAYAILPTPLPQDAHSEANDYWFSDSATQELMAVMDACLYNLYDVPRAKGIFDRLRTKSSAALETRVTNAMLEAYLKMASQSETEYWMEALWELVDATPDPSASTYAIMLLAIQRFPEHATTFDQPGGRPQTSRCRSFDSVLANAIQSNIPVDRLISDRVFTEDEEAAHIIERLTASAIKLNIPDVVAELGKAHNLGVDVDDDTPTVNPVKKADDTIPFNLSTLRKHLAHVALARRILPTDINARQRLLENSMFEAARERLLHQAEVFEQLANDDQSLLKPNLQRWMWQWHLRLKVRLRKLLLSVHHAQPYRRNASTKRSRRLLVLSKLSPRVAREPRCSRLTLRSSRLRSSACSLLSRSCVSKTVAASPTA